MVENRFKLLMVGFLALIAAGMGFGVRGALLGGPWSQEYGFTFTELGTITGGGLTGFGVIILIAGLLLDKFGYKKLLVLALFCHVISAVMLFAATPVYEAFGKGATFQVLFWSTFIFAIANGICEAVINPLTAAAYPEQKTHYLNILHAGWPGGLVLGGLVALLISDTGPSWELLLATYLIPTVAYGYLTMREKFPSTDAQKGEISYGGMLKNCLVPFFLVLLIVHAMVGYVELGTDSWITKITGSILNNPTHGVMLFIYASTLMFILRFFAGPIVHRISPLGLLLGSAIIGSLGLFIISESSGVMVVVLAVTIYSFGKAFLWPTMLGVVGDRFPRSSTVAMALLGFAGMMSAGLLGGPGIGYKQDRFASAKLQELSPPAYERYQAEKELGFLVFKPVKGLDGAKVGVISDNGAKLSTDKEIAEKAGEWEGDKFKSLRSMDSWWQGAKAFAEDDAPHVSEAGIHGSRSAIRITAIIPAIMAVFYLLMVIGFKMRGGYKAVDHESSSES